MTFFEEQLKQGIFQISYCEKCDEKIWPPNEICHVCFNKSEWKKSQNLGKIIEFSKKDSTYFGLVEIDHGIRIMGEISSTSIPKTGQSVTMNVSFDYKPNYSFIVENN